MSAERNHPRFGEFHDRFLKSADDLLEGRIGREQFALVETLQLIRLISTDPRTGLLDSEGLKRTLEVAIKSAVEGNKPVSVIYIDGNQFKKINDHPNLGHDIGDKVIVAMAKAIDIFRRESLTAHLTEDIRTGVISDPSNQGGDEFVLVCFDPLHKAIKHAKDLKILIPEYVHHEVPELWQHLGGFSISTGTAELAKVREKIGEKVTWYAKEDADALIKRAEQTMYQKRRAERGWRNKVLHAPTHIRGFLATNLTRFNNIRGGH